MSWSMGAGNADTPMGVAIEVCVRERIDDLSAGLAAQLPWQLLMGTYLSMAVTAAAELEAPADEVRQYLQQVIRDYPDIAAANKLSRTKAQGNS